MLFLWNETEMICPLSDISPRTKHSLIDFVVLIEVVFIASYEMVQKRI